MSIRANDTINAVVDLLATDPTITAQCMGTGRVYPHFAPKPPADPAWGRITVRQLDVGGLPEHATGLVHLPVQVLVEVKGVPDPALLLEATHQRVQTLLTGLRVETPFGTGYVALERRRRPTPPRYDDETGGYYSAALFSTVLR